MAEAILSGGKSDMKQKGEGPRAVFEGKWTKSTMKLRSDGAWSIEESSGFEYSHARGNSAVSGAGTWAFDKEQAKLVLTVAFYDSGNSDPRAPEPDEVGKTYMLDLAALQAGGAASPFFKIDLKFEQDVPEFVLNLGDQLKGTAARLASDYCRELAQRCMPEPKS
ncbi:unnamed protein product [Symbiodinium natans]|uniref:Uncharacterized protein n=1 Tax=Symbiodinium natans TaxID=878477 RepID=A0A812P1Y0_9DINO|nr:unnamed protein product [Symbiodinium natans]